MTRTEIENALAAVAPEIKGAEDLALLPLSPPSHGAVMEQLERSRTRKSLLDARMAAFDAGDAAEAALVADGYPAVPKASVPADVLAELNAELAAMSEALNDFELEPTAEVISVSLGEPSTKE